MSFKGAIRAFLFSNSSVAQSLSDTGTLVNALIAGAITVIVVTGLSTAPSSRGQVLLKNAAGNYEFVNYTSVTESGGDYTFVVSHTIVQSYDVGDYVAIAYGVYSFPAPQEAELPYVLLQRVTTTEIYNKLDGQGTVVVEQWQASCYAVGDETCETIKDAVITALNMVIPDFWSDSGFSTSYKVETSVFEAETTIPELKDDGSQNFITHKPITITIIRSISAS